MSIPKSTLNRIDRSSWTAFALGKAIAPKHIAAVKKWLRENASSDYYVSVIKETVGQRRLTIATFVRIKEAEDSLLFKLTWCGWE